MRDKDGLTFKQAAFRDNYVINGGNGTDAAIKAGYSIKTAGEIAKENLKKPYLKAAIEHKMAELAEKVDVSVEFIVEKLLYGLNLAIERNNTVAMARFLELLGRYKAMFTDNLSTTDTQRQRELDAEEAIEASELARLRLAQKYGLKGDVKAG